jgi:hypothetical protein
MPSKGIGKIDWWVMDAEATSSNQSADNAGPSSSQAAAVPPPSLDELLVNFYADVRDVDRDNEVNRW